MIQRRCFASRAGVDISPLVWVAILSFFSEILTGPQGILTIVQRNAM